ncbi:MAG: sigma 54-interacting transcriptional regulator [Clostridiales Family XIII bacterium]|jgi:transcriptional regulator with PAS, ATPase and Fis domain|nr:sigma 54-interacting transcriptional regulator [Clostridiales Family XIII bacterium]
MRYKEIAEPLYGATILDEADTLDAAVAAFASLNDDCGVLWVRGANGEISGFLTARSLIRAAAAHAKDVVDALRAASIGVIQSRKGDDVLDLRDFEHNSILLISDGKDAPSGFVRKHIAVRALLDDVSRRLAETARQIEPLGGEDYTGNWIFRLPAYNTAEELRKLIDAIADANAKMLKILKFSADSIFVADGKGIAIFANKAFDRPAALEGAKYLNKRAEELEKQGHIRPALTPMIIREGKSLTIMQEVVNRFGRVTEWIVTGVPIFTEQGALEMIVTNAKSVEEYEQLKHYVEKARGKAFARTVVRDDDKIICFGGQMQAVVEMAEKAAQTDCTVLITGESGTGKSLLARYIHAKSARSGKSMVEVNCNSIPEMLFESEFFGYESGAFTGAKAGGKPGLLEIAHGGSMLLDEIGDLALPLQAKLLKVLQDKRVTRIGGFTEIDVDVRIIAATNHSLNDRMADGSFRADLYYRLNLFPIHIVPLRERTGDIPMLIDHFLRLFNLKHGKQAFFSDPAIDAMCRWEWPGNVRQLEYFVERMVILFDSEIGKGDLGFGEKGVAGVHGSMAAAGLQVAHGLHEGRGFQEGRGLRGARGGAVTVSDIIPLQDALYETERQLFALASESGHSSYEIARILGTSQANAYRKIKKYITDPVSK